jgi:hypothetical protein
MNLALQTGASDVRLTVKCPARLDLDTSAALTIHTNRL